MTKAHVLGIPLDNLSRQELNQSIARLLRRHRGHIVTPNPEFLLEAQKDPEFFSALNKADLSIPDGIGLKFALWLKGQNLKRYTGSNMVLELLALSDKQHLRIAIINWTKGLSNDEEILQAIKKRYPKLVCFIHSIDRDFKNYNVQALRNFRPDIVFVCLGAPWQEKFIRFRLLKDLPNIRFAMGVGGSFDFLTGRIKRAPKFIQFFGFEWLWRLLMQPWRLKLWRLKRIWRAVVIFPLAVIAWEFRRFYYRKNVVALIVNQYNETLILNSAGKRTYWGLPQGGVDRGESLETAVRREIFEETSLKDLEILAVFPNSYQYDWPKHYTHRGYKGQRQSFFIIKYNGPRNLVKTNPLEHKAYRWVRLDQLIRAASPVHRKQYQVFLQKYYELKHKK